MTPLFFGNRKTPLFGIYHAPLAKSARDVGVLVCNPFGREAIRAHRALRQLSLMLSRARFHVLRFDYFGTGDSSGSSEEGTVKTWCKDIVTATEELRGTAGVEKVAWVGLRLGATLATLAARGRKDVHRLVTWDPIVRGDTYLSELHRRHEEFIRYEHRWQRDWKPPSTGVDDMVEAMGFPISKELKQEILGIDLVQDPTFSAKKSALIISEETDAHRALRDRLSTDAGKLPPSISYELVAASAWNSAAAMNSSLVPTQALEAIVNYLSEGRA